MVILFIILLIAGAITALVICINNFCDYEFWQKTGAWALTLLSAAMLTFAAWLGVSYDREHNYYGGFTLRPQNCYILTQAANNAAADQYDYIYTCDSTSAPLRINVAPISDADAAALQEKYQQEYQQNMSMLGDIRPQLKAAAQHSIDELKAFHQDKRSKQGFFSRIKLWFHDSELNAAIDSVENQLDSDLAANAGEAELREDAWDNGFLLSWNDSAVLYSAAYNCRSYHIQAASLNADRSGMAGLSIRPAGFFMGFFDGCILPFAAIAAIWLADFYPYKFINNGTIYLIGFIVGLLVLIFFAAWLVFLLNKYYYERKAEIERQRNYEWCSHNIRKKEQIFTAVYAEELRGGRKLQKKQLLVDTARREYNEYKQEMKLLQASDSSKAQVFSQHYDKSLKSEKYFFSSALQAEYDKWKQKMSAKEKIHRYETIIYNPYMQSQQKSLAKAEQTLSEYYDKFENNSEYEIESFNSKVRSTWFDSVREIEWIARTRCDAMNQIMEYSKSEFKVVMNNVNIANAQYKFLCYKAAMYAQDVKRITKNLTYEQKRNFDQAVKMGLSDAKFKGMNIQSLHTSISNFQNDYNMKANQAWDNVRQTWSGVGDFALDIASDKQFNKEFGEKGQIVVIGAAVAWGAINSLFNGINSLIDASAAKTRIKTAVTEAHAECCKAIKQNRANIKLAEAFVERANETNERIQEFMELYETDFSKLYYELFPDGDESKSKNARKARLDKGEPYYTPEEFAKITNLKGFFALLNQMVDAEF